jgi:hypothetical protein
MNLSGLGFPSHPLSFAKQERNLFVARFQMAIVAEELFGLLLRQGHTLPNRRVNLRNQSITLKTPVQRSVSDVAILQQLLRAGGSRQARLTLEDGWQRNW